MQTDNQGRIIETAVEARAGFLDRPVLQVLVISCVLAVVAMIMVFLGVLKF